MVRILVVIDDLGNPNLRHIADSFRGVQVSACDQNITVEQIELHNPDCILSIGEVESTCALWRLPLWRRRTWLSVPDMSVSPLALRQSLLSSITASIDAGVFSDIPALSVWNGKAQNLKSSAVRWLTLQSYDNWEYQEVDLRDFGSFARNVVSSLASTRDGLLWVTNGSLEFLSQIFLENVVSLWESKNFEGCLLIADTVDRVSLLNNLVDNEPLLIRHVFLDRKSFFADPSVTLQLPINGLVGLMAQVLCNKSTHVVPYIEGISFDRSLLWNEKDEIESMLALGPIQWANWRINSQVNEINQDTIAHELSSI